MTNTPSTSTHIREADVIVIGAGPTGQNVAQYAIEGGLSVIAIEAGLVGGECSYYACIPSKILLEAGTIAATTAHTPGVDRAHIDVARTLRRRDAWVKNYEDSGQAEWLTGIGATVIRGFGRIVGERDVEVNGQLLRAHRAVVIATGSVPVVPDILADVHAWDSRDATGVRDIPESVAIVGGGVVAVEAATWLASLGSAVTLVSSKSELLPGCEQGVGDAVREGLEAQAVTVLLDTDVVAASRKDARATGLGVPHGGPLTLELENHSRGSEHGNTASRHHLTVSEVVAATGRAPRVEDLGFDNVGLSATNISEGTLPSWLHVVGDSGPGASLTHMGKYEARVLGSRLADAGEWMPPRQPPVPQVVFTRPHIASVGFTQAQARDAGHDIAVARVSITAAAGVTISDEKADGFATLVVDAATGLVLGATFVGPHVAELVHAATVAIVGEVPVRTLRHAVPAFPTSSELWLRLLEELPRHLRS